MLMCDGAGRGKRLAGAHFLVGGLEDGEGGLCPDRLLPEGQIHGAGRGDRDLGRCRVASAQPAQQRGVLDRRGDGRAGQASPAARQQCQSSAGRLVAAGMEGHLVGTHAEALGEDCAGLVQQRPAAAPGSVPRRGVGPRDLVGCEQGFEGLSQDRSRGGVEEPGGSRGPTPHRGSSEVSPRDESLCRATCRG